MKYEPHDYQAYMTRRIVENPQVGLFAEMGLGKTVATLTALDELIYDRFVVDRVLVVAPLRVARDTWFDEVAKWGHLGRLRLARVLGTEAERLKALRQEADIYVINRENVAWLVRKRGAAWPFDMVVIDELSSFKSPKSQRFRALRRVRPQIRRLVGLTGTPTPNGLEDLWAQMFLLDEGKRLGRTVSEYRRNYFTPASGYGNVTFSYALRPGAEKEIFDRIGDITVSLRTEDHLKLPDRINNRIDISMPQDVWEKYKRMERDAVLELGDAPVAAPTAGVLSGKLLQMANGAVYDAAGGVAELHELKLDALGEILGDAQGDPVLVYYSYIHDKDRIMKRFPQARHLNTSADIRAWNTGRVSLMLAHPASAGHGLNLQMGGHRIVWFGLPWSLELYQQANARLHRQGQTRPVIIHHLVMKGTLDVAVMRALRRKDAGQAALLAAVRALADEVRSAVSPRPRIGRR